jgi:hypothetical protein
MRKIKVRDDSIIETREPRVMLRQQEKEVERLEKKLLLAKDEVISLEQKLFDARMAKSATVLNFTKRNQAIRLLNKHDYLSIVQDASEYWVSCDYPSVNVEDEHSEDYICASERHFFYENNNSHWYEIHECLTKIIDTVKKRQLLEKS